MGADIIRKRGPSQPQMRTNKKRCGKFAENQGISGIVSCNDGVGDASAPSQGGATMLGDADDWYGRWERAILDYHAQDPKGNSFKAISLRAGLARSYVSNTLGKRTIPRVDDFLAVCDVIGVNPVYILKGLDWTPEQARVARLYSRLDPGERDALLRLLDRSARD